MYYIYESALGFANVADLFCPSKVSFSAQFKFSCVVIHTPINPVLKSRYRSVLLSVNKEKEKQDNRRVH